ncbi:MAG: VWA domain-containing protein, partial [Clostridia bacterium]|nr:VWA domain-containing protein [Clostridia bacterium]
MLAAVIIPFAIAIRKDNRNASVITTLALHLVIVALITLAAAGMGVTKVITETEVYVVADVSYSANKNLDYIDSYISEIEEDLPRNSSIGIVAFGKDYELLSPIGNELRSVKDSNVDASATDIAKALEYTASLFKKDTIKIIILITDGKQTDGNALAVSKVIDDIEASDIRLDAIYIDDNITEDMSEVQISSVDYTPATYLNHQSEADVIIQSNQATQAIVTLQRGDDITNKAVNLNKGF